MSETMFIIQNQDSIMSPDVAAVVESLEQRMFWCDGKENRFVYWQDQRDPRCLDYEGDTIDLKDFVAKYGVRNIVPVGSIDYVNSFGKEFLGLEPIHAINLHRELATPYFAHRWVYPAMYKKDLDSFVKAGKVPTRFVIKPGRHPKRFEACRSDDTTVIIPEDEPLFVSSYIKEDIVAEWRCFVRNGRILGIRPYLLNEWVAPDIKFVEQAVEKVGRDYPAYTIDIGILESGASFVVEIHNFIACGLYGFEGAELTLMLRDAWRFELDIQAGKAELHNEPV